MTWNELSAVLYEIWRLIYLFLCTVVHEGSMINVTSGLQDGRSTLDLHIDVLLSGRDSMR